MTKREIIEQVSDRSGITQQTVRIILEETLNVLTDTFTRHEDVFIRGFATFAVKQSQPKKGYDIKRGKGVDIPPRYTVKLKPTATLKQAMNPEDA